MTLEEKDLLWKDLSARVPYGVKINTPRGIYTVDGVSNDGLFSIPNDDNSLDDLTPHDGHYWLPIIEDYKPYLRPMSSMTKDEEKELGNYLSTEVFLSRDGLHSVLRAQRYTSNFLYSRHLDILGLIEKGLAIEAPEDMYK